MLSLSRRQRRVRVKPARKFEEVIEAEVVEPIEPEVTEAEAEDEENDVDLNEGFEIDPMLVRRPQGRPKGVLDYKVPVHAIEGEYKKSVMVAALTHLYYMQDRQFAPDNVSLHHFQSLLNISRHTVYRCLDDVKEGKVLALKLHAELMVMSENLLQAERNRLRRQNAKMRESQARIMKRRKFERRMRRALMETEPDETPEPTPTPTPTPIKIAPKRRDKILSD